MTSKLIVEPFMNSIGQTINPGDKIFYFVRSIHSELLKGVYRGVYKNGSEVRVAVIENYVALQLVHKTTGIRFQSDPRYVELWDKYYENQKKTFEIREAHLNAINELMKDFHEVPIEYQLYTTLFRNRVFLAGTPIDEIDYV